MISAIRSLRPALGRLTLAVLYVVGHVASFGHWTRRLFESVLERLPFVAKVYTSVRQLLGLDDGEEKSSSQRVVLIDFPIASEERGFLTRTFNDAATGPSVGRRAGRRPPANPAHRRNGGR